VIFISSRHHRAWHVKSPFTFRKIRSTSDTASETPLELAVFDLSSKSPGIASTGFWTSDSSVSFVSMASIKAASSISELHDKGRGETFSAILNR
jgi:hypothetical protein